MFYEYPPTTLSFFVNHIKEVIWDHERTNEKFEESGLLATDVIRAYLYLKKTYYGREELACDFEANPYDLWLGIFCKKLEVALFFWVNASGNTRILVGFSGDPNSEFCRNHLERLRTVFGKELRILDESLTIRTQHIIFRLLGGPEFKSFLGNRHFLNRNRLHWKTAISG